MTARGLVTILLVMTTRPLAAVKAHLSQVIDDVREAEVQMAQGEALGEEQVRAALAERRP